MLTDPAKIILKIAKNFKPAFAIILGTGLGKLADDINSPIIIPYAELPGFHISTVSGHAGKLILGYVRGIPVVCMQGRAHPYENVNADTFRVMIHTLKQIGCGILVATNAVGSLDPNIGPGSLVVIKDHINFQGNNSLVGLQDESLGSRFISMNDAYDPALREHLKIVASRLGMPMTEGVYIATLGPSFETKAEIKAFRYLGADVVGMSTVPEVTVARQCGLKVLTVSAVTNYAAGIGNEVLSHELTLHHGNLISAPMSQLISSFIHSWSATKHANYSLNHY